MEDAYSGYSYKRYKPKRSVFLFVVIPVALAILFFASNLVFGFVVFGGGKSANMVEIPHVVFYATHTTPHTNKSDAMRTSTEIKNAGGSGYLVSNNNSWTVVNDIRNTNFDTATKYTTRKTNIALTDKAHYKLVSALIGSFKSTFDTLCDFRDKYDAGEITKAEISDLARIAYMNLVDLRGELELVGGYTALYSYLTRQLFGLNLLWLEVGTAGFSHVLKNSASWVIFALHDLSNIV